MSKEKQIEEMAKVMCGYYGTEKCYDCRYCCDCHIKQEANRLYDAGYRRVILCKNCEFCEQRYPVKEIGEEAKESWYCYARNCRVEPEEYCSFAKMKGGAE